MKKKKETVYFSQIANFCSRKKIKEGKEEKFKEGKNKKKKEKEEITDFCNQLTVSTVRGWRGEKKSERKNTVE